MDTGTGKLNIHIDPEVINHQIDSITQDLETHATPEIFQKLFSFIDLTTLNSTDTPQKVLDLCHKVNALNTAFPGIPNVAALCVYPNFIPLIHKHLNARGVGIASVAAGFPSSQTFLEIKLNEVRLAIESGATEIDTVLPLGLFLSGDDRSVSKEISDIKSAAGQAKLKIILETGALSDLKMVRKASFISMEAGADFIKTSTGKFSPPATPGAFLVMALAIQEFYHNTGTKVGIKPAGGIVSAKDALVYYAIVKKILGMSWLNKDLFRIGASRLANNLLKKIRTKPPSTNTSTGYF